MSLLIRVSLEDTNEIDFLVELRKKNESSLNSPERPEQNEEEVSYARPQFSSIIERIERAYASGPQRSSKNRKRKRKSSDESGSSHSEEDSREYDLNDSFIDDSEIVFEGDVPQTSERGFYITKGENNNSSERSSPVVFSSNTNNNTSSSNKEMKRVQFVEKWIDKLKYVPSEKLYCVLNQLRETSKQFSSSKSIPRELDNILSEIDSLDRKESSRLKNRSNAFYALVMNCFTEPRSKNSLQKRFREFDLRDAEINARTKFQEAHETFLNWIKATSTDKTKAFEFSAEGRGLLVDAISYRESYTAARNELESATKSKREVNLIKPRTDVQEYMLSLVDLFPNSCVSIKQLRKQRTYEKARRKRVEDRTKKNQTDPTTTKKDNTSAASSSSAAVSPSLVVVSPTTSISPTTSVSPPPKISGSSKKNCDDDKPLRSYFYMDPPMFNPNDFIEEE